MISISYIGLCGGNDFRCPGFKEDGFSAGKAGGHPVKKRRYALENKTISKPLKVHIYSSELHLSKRAGAEQLPGETKNSLKSLLSLIASCVYELLIPSFDLRLRPSLICLATQRASQENSQG